MRAWQLRSPSFAVTSALILCAPLGASRATWIVDAGNGPGAQFREIAPALAAARPGDTIFVRAGVYPAVTIQKGIRLIGAPGAVLDPRWAFFRVVDLPAGENAVIAGFEVLAGKSLRFQLQNNLGRVTIENVRTAGPWPEVGDRTVGLFVSDCRLVVVNRCRTFGTPAVHAERSKLRMTGCELYGMSSIKGHFLGHGLRLRDADATVADSTIAGATDAMFEFLSVPGIDAIDSELSVTGGPDSWVQGGRRSYNAATEAVTADGGSTRIDPDLALNPFFGRNGAGAVLGTVTWTTIPSLSASGGTQQENRGIEVSGPPWAPTFVFAGAARPPTPTPLGELWLDPMSSVVIAGGVIGPDRRFELPLPALSNLPAGTTVAVQAALDLREGPRLSTAAVVVVH